MLCDDTVSQYYDTVMQYNDTHPEILSPDLRGMFAKLISLPWIMMEGKGHLFYSC